MDSEGRGLAGPGLGAKLPGVLLAHLWYGHGHPACRVSSATFLWSLCPYQAILLLCPLGETWLADHQGRLLAVL